MIDEYVVKVGGRCNGGGGSHLMQRMAGISFNKDKDEEEMLRKFGRIALNCVFSRIALGDFDSSLHLSYMQLFSFHPEETSCRLAICTALFAVNPLTGQSLFFN